MNPYSNTSIASQNSAASVPPVTELPVDGNGQVAPVESYASTDTGREIPVPEAAAALSEETSNELDGTSAAAEEGVIGANGKGLKHTMLDNALTFLGNYDDIAKAMVQHGAENMGPVLQAVGDPLTIAQMLKKIMSQVTKGVYWEFVKAELAQQRATRLAGGGVNGQEITCADFFTDRDYPANEGSPATPSDMYRMIDDIYVDLAAPFAQLAEALGWDTTLPYTSKETAGGWVTAITIDQAFQFLDTDRAEKAKKKELKTANIVADLANLKL